MAFSAIPGVDSYRYGALDGLGKYLATTGLPDFSVGLQRKNRHGLTFRVYTTGSGFQGVFSAKGRGMGAAAVFQDKSGGGSGLCGKQPFGALDKPGGHAIDTEIGAIK